MPTTTPQNAGTATGADLRNRISGAMRTLRARHWAYFYAASQGFISPGTASEDPADELAPWICADRAVELLLGRVVSCVPYSAADDTDLAAKYASKTWTDESEALSDLVEMFRIIGRTPSKAFLVEFHRSFWFFCGLRRICAASAAPAFPANLAGRVEAMASAPSSIPLLAVSDDHSMTTGRLFFMRYILRKVLPEATSARLDQLSGELTLLFFAQQKPKSPSVVIREFNRLVTTPAPLDRAGLQALQGAAERFESHYATRSLYQAGLFIQGNLETAVMDLLTRVDCGVALPRCRIPRQELVIALWQDLKNLSKD